MKQRWKDSVVTERMQGLSLHQMPRSWASVSWRTGILALPLSQSLDSEVGEGREGSGVTCEVWDCMWDMAK